ncbi:MAG: hypothetical protein JSS32_08130 [Verrucomicrobia bacterium]|nr:hypothetical protein [Verrucomicrobiota bacterium]
MTISIHASSPVSAVVNHTNYQPSINLLQQEIYYFMVPGADIQGNIARIKDLLNKIDTSGYTPTEMKYFNDAKQKLLDAMNTGDFAPENLLQIAQEFGATIACPNASNSDFHLHGWMAAAVIYFSYIMCNSNLLYGIDMNGNMVNFQITNEIDRSALYLAVNSAYSDLQAYMPQHQGEFDSASYAAIEKIVSKDNQKMVQDFSQIYQSWVKGTDPDPAVFRDVGLAAYSILGYFNLPPTH